MVSIKREIWTVKGKRKAFAVVREKGKIKSRVKWSPRKPIKQLFRKYQEDRTLREGERRFKTSRAIEVTRQDNIKPRRSFAVRASISIKGEIITATSLNIRWGSLREAREQARGRLFMKVDEYFTGGYDADDGEKLLTSSEISRIRYETVYYK